MKKYMMATVFFFFSIGSVYSQSLPSVSVIDRVVDYGISQADVCVSFQNNGSVSAFQFDISYDNTVVCADTMELETYDNGHRIVSNEITPGLHRFLVYSLSNTVTSDTVLITLPFTVMQTGTQTILSVQNVILSDTSATQCSAGSISNGTLTLAGADSDNDGMPDIWETGYVADLTIMNSQTDFDNDGFKDLYEYHAGTDPTDPESLLRIAGIQTETLLPSAKCIKITWRCEDSKTYTIFWRDMSPGAVWDEVEYDGMESDIISDGATQSWTDRGTDPQMEGQAPSNVECRIYKVVVDQSE